MLPEHMQGLGKKSPVELVSRTGIESRSCSFSGNEFPLLLEEGWMKRHLPEEDFFSGFQKCVLSEPFDFRGRRFSGHCNP